MKQKDGMNDRFLTASKTQLKEEVEKEEGEEEGRRVKNECER